MPIKLVFDDDMLKINFEMDYDFKPSEKALKNAEVIN